MAAIANSFPSPTRAVRGVWLPQYLLQGHGSTEPYVRVRPVSVGGFKSNYQLADVLSLLLADSAVLLSSEVGMAFNQQVCSRYAGRGLVEDRTCCASCLQYHTKTSL